MDTQNDQLTIQEVAQATGLSVYTLRYYERIGLIHSIGRLENTHRRYSMGDVGWIGFLTKLRATGMSIQEMQAYAELQRQGESSLPQRVEMLRKLREQVEARIDEMYEHRKLLTYKIDTYEKVITENCVKTP